MPARTARGGRTAPAPAAAPAIGTRAAIIDATIAIMRADGYAAVTSRRIAATAGLRSKLVHYYFGTMDELFLAVYKRIEDEHFARLTRVLASRQPLGALWRLATDTTNTGMVIELIALANHRKILRAEIARDSERLRRLQAAVIERVADEAGQAGAPLPPMLLSVLALAVSRLLAMDSVLGVSAGHAETLRWIEAFLASIEAGRPFAPPDEAA